MENSATNIKNGKIIPSDDPFVKNANSIC